MTGATLLYCVGATKAGTSWLYGALRDHPDCSFRAVKEAHYWDTFDAGDRDRQIAAFRARLKRAEASRARAAAEGRDAAAARYALELRELGSLIEVLGGDRTGDRAYHDWLRGQVDDETRLYGDMTPSYALLSDDMLRRMLALSPLTKVVYLIRDPLARLWSHVRMQASRTQKPGDRPFEERANAQLLRLVSSGQDTHVLDRGDYAEAIGRLRRVVPEGQLLIEFFERMFTEDGWARICGFLGLDATPVARNEKVHEGAKAQLREDLAAQAAGFLKDQYDWVARNVGPLPRQWQDNLARASA